MGKIKVLKNAQEKFTNSKDQEVKFHRFEWCDDEGNKFKGTVKKGVEITAEKGDEGTATFEVTSGEKGFVKFVVIEFVRD